MQDAVCPLCRDAKRMAKKPMRLYGTLVCRKCYYRFANRRQLAYVIDAVLFQVFAFFVGMALAMAMTANGSSDDTIDTTMIVTGWLILPLVFFLKDGFKGHSPGKALCDVQAVHQQTYQTIGFIASFKRNLILIVPVMPLIIAYLLQRGHRWGDGWAKSKVIWKRYANHPVFTGRLACEHCQYDLRGITSDRCPECGTPLSPENRVRLDRASAVAPPTTPPSFSGA
jgi:uncharacterized RDD family membrane protein YckC